MFRDDEVPKMTVKRAGRGDEVSLLKEVVSHKPEGVLERPGIVYLPHPFEGDLVQTQKPAHLVGEVTIVALVEDGCKDLLNGAFAEREGVKRSCKFVGVFHEH